ncbi:hypothetical protein TrVE_jg4585 [Triparma verrucosa]|uniref:Coiled-coil domain-containing protein 135 n=1 Tax=Triparma verrucosa TaxID=1606542 RepID=A0A9W7CF73_9STRA|nr:hypothetical protein TrVE_jg4585 [Triparma verrucosa]
MSFPQISAQGNKSTKTARTKSLLKAAKEGLIPTPDAYVSNNHKENLCLEYVKTFEDNFTRLFPDRVGRYLTSKNEFGVEKFVCTSVRPTQLQYREMYNVNKCAEFIAHYLDYEPLENPKAPPSTLPSSTQVLDWCVGDSFDFATLLCSYLLGAGYDAYVVQGYAPKYICERDQSETACPFVGEDEGGGGEAEDGGEGGEESKSGDEKKDDDEAEKSYKVKKHGSIESQFIKQNSGGGEAFDGPIPKPKFKPDPIQWDSDDENENAQEEAAAKDPLHGKRVHAWVLVRGGKRDVEEMLFVEPTTARVYPVSESPYLGVESIWNAKNYWVNMQWEEELISHSYDFANPDLWEFVFIDSGIIPLVEKKVERSIMEMVNDPSMEDKEEGDEEDGEGKEEEEEEGEVNILDIPESWVDKLAIKRSNYNLTYPPYGHRTVLYKKAKLELFAVNTHEQGMVKRLTLYKDLARTIVKECWETFVNRRDRLIRRVRCPLERKVHESFGPGRLLSLKHLIEWTGKRREMHFYVNARLDGLKCREEDVGKKIIERFEGRGDRLVYRSIKVKENVDGSKSTFLLQGGMQNNDLLVLKMTEKYDRNAYKSAKEDIAKRTFYVSENKVRTHYHYADSCITRSTLVHDKERAAEDVGESLTDVINAEKDCLTAARYSQNETADVLTTRKHEEEDIIVDQPVFETAGGKKEEEKEEEKTEEMADEKDRRQLDYLTPFLQNIDPKSMSREDAQKVREACMKALKDRLLERANIIQNRLNEENSALAKHQASFQRNQRDNDPDTEEEFERQCSEAMFRIQILEQRLVQHEENALKKFKDMDQKLLADPRMNVLR